jgi:single-strand DNA-binding protein
MINNVVLVGRLTKDIDLKYTGSGTAVGTFTMAVQRNFTDQSGKRESDFINCVIWRKSAENMANFTRKGSLVGIEGRIQTRNYDNQQGQRVWITEVVADKFSLMESKQVTEQRPRENTYKQDQQKEPTGMDASNNQGINYTDFSAYEGPSPFATGESYHDEVPF